ncbi:MAG: thioredoxin [Firmicutes bacterium]|uniref:Thioredoxin n=1 Tax=Candidatus Colimorpha enterica TaxID=3083063 RepID=A0AAE3K0P4_9BACT|nr:thioredoxin [Candidatus Colimorpha enterica]MCI5756165.1 thioredoxin [Candidatus Colimorpha enterica]MDY2906587.1 thioredoxin [Eubacteriales bacterium]OLA58253.1 MAG: thioredoxin [Firmicutes bacterium CAG:272_52_7]
MEVNESNFKEFTGEKDRLVVLDFWAEWCGPCRMLAPVLEEIGTEYPEVAFGKVNVDEEAGLAQMFGIVSIPTLVFMKNGKIIKKSVGYLDADGLRAVLDGLI